MSAQEQFPHQQPKEVSKDPRVIIAEAMQKVFDDADRVIERMKDPSKPIHPDEFPALEEVLRNAWNTAASRDNMTALAQEYKKAFEALDLLDRELAE